MHTHGHAHAHGAGPWFDYPWNRTGRILGAVAIVALAVTIIGSIAVWPTEDREAIEILSTAGVDRLDATVTAVVDTECIGLPESTRRCIDVVFELSDGQRGVFQQSPTSIVPDFEAGDDIIVGDAGPTVDERFRYFFVDFERTGSLLALTILFAIAVVLLGRLQGVRSLLALLLSFVILVGFTLPALLESSSPVLVAIIGSIGVAAVTLYVTHGINHLTTVSLLGSMASLAVTGILAWLFVNAASITGLSDEDALFLLTANSELDLRGILLAGIIIGTVGVLDDVTVTQSAAVAEIRAADPDMGSRRVYSSALRVGRDHIGSTTNTLVFAYAGAALPLLMLLALAELPLSTVLTSEIIAFEIIRALVGSIGLIAAVPITTALAAWVVSQPPNTADEPDDTETV